MSAPGSVVSPVPLGRRIVRRVWRVLRSVLIGYLLVLLVLSHIQERLIFPGGHMTQGQPDAQVTPARGQELVRLKTANGFETVALFAPALTAQGELHPDPRHCPTILYFYGNGMCLAQTMDWEFDHFPRLGCNVLAPEFVGYGMADGKPSEKNCYATADAAFAYVRSRGDIDPDRIICAGWSLGAAVACDLACRKQHEGVVGLVMCSGFTSLDDLAWHYYPFAPTRWLLRHHFRSVDKIGGFRGPILLVHGQDDEIIPFAMSLQLRAAAEAGGAKVRHVAVAGAGHNDLFLNGEREVLEAMRGLVGEVAAGRRAE